MIVRQRPYELLVHPERYTDPDRIDRRYVRFELTSAEDMWDELLTIEGFDTDTAAQDGFSDAALTYRRDPEYPD